MSHTMVLDGVTSQMIPRLIGRNGQSIKKIISSSWRMYDNYQGQGRGVGENKPKLVIKIVTVTKAEAEADAADDDKAKAKVEARIITESDSMRKFASHALRAAAKVIVDKATGNTFRLYAEMPHSCIGMLLGKKAQTMRRDIEDIAQEIEFDYEPQYGECAKKAWTKVTGTKCPPLALIRDADDKSFIGFEPDSPDTEVIEILVSTRGLPPNVFLDLVNRLSEKLDERIKRISDTHQVTMSSIEDALEFDTGFD